MREAPVLDARMYRLLQLGGELVTPPGGVRRKFEPAHMHALLARLGNPERRFRSVLIAGTNGKGSTAATLASILTAAGYRTGLYTSPHLERVNERIRLGNISPGRAASSLVEIEDEALFASLAKVEAASDALVAEGILPGAPSFFETMTAIAMLAFQSPGGGDPVEIAILEVGLGGRLDATNVVDPLFSIITDISLDHTEWLGTTIAEIAREKAGILRSGGVMITLPQHPEANQSLGEVAVSLGVRGFNAAQYLPFGEDAASDENRYAVEVEGERLDVDSPLSGRHQQRNLALAVAAAVELRNSHGYKLSKKAIEAGIRETSWPGRLEEIARPSGPRILLDVAHNPAGAWALRAALSARDRRSDSLPSAKTLIFGCMRDKAPAEMAQILFPIFDHIFLVELASPRAASLSELAAAAEQTGASFSLFSGACEALEAASVGATGRESAELIVACGSVFLVGALRSCLGL